MKKYTQIYFDYFGFDKSDTLFCEICGAVAVDLNHIEPKGMGGNPKGDKDVIENLQAVCRPCHIKFADKKQYKEMLKETHKKFMEDYGRKK